MKRDIDHLPSELSRQPENHQVHTKYHCVHELYCSTIFGIASISFSLGVRSAGLGRVMSAFK
jgi:hypothetical protein